MLCYRDRLSKKMTVKKACGVLSAGLLCFYCLQSIVANDGQPFIFFLFIQHYRQPGLLAATNAMK